MRYKLQMACIFCVDQQQPNITNIRVSKFSRFKINNVIKWPTDLEAYILTQ